MTAWGTVAVALAASSLVALAGCMGTGPAGLADAAGADVAPQTGFTFSSAGCYEAGFQAVYSGQRTFAGTWNTANAKEEYGDPILDSSGTQLPLLPINYANVHQGFKCEATEFEGNALAGFTFGFVGDPIVAPPFDVGGADLHFLLSFIGLQQASLPYQAMDERSTARISPVTDSSIVFLEGDLSMERFRVHEEFATADNGVYEGTSDMVKYRDVAPRTIRLWWTVPSDGSESPIGAHEGHDENPEGADELDWNPIYWDLQTQGGAQWTTPQLNGNNDGCHGGIDDHGPAGKLCQPVQTSIFEHKALTLTMGPVLKDVLIDDYWFH